MMTLSSLPSTYNKDLQSDKELMFGAYDKLMGILEVVIGTVESVQVVTSVTTHTIVHSVIE